MGHNYDTPVELHGLEVKIIQFTKMFGFDIAKVFEDWLRFIIANFSLEQKPLDNWRYSKEQDLMFHNLMIEWFSVMQAKLTTDTSWYDALGELYMSMIVSVAQAQSSGQFFTPHHICDLLQNITGGDTTNTVVGQNISDPTCGSGRILIAFHVHNLGNYLCAEDINYVCCLMTVCNFMIHGCVGEVVWHDSLNPDTWFGAWIVNPMSSVFRGIPHVGGLTKEHSKVWQYWEDRKMGVEQKGLEIKLQTPIKTQVTQLELF